jgi:D-xylose 1-dehydrogenase (NADP+, D-xylono-1,5-lactone-forming)
VNWGFLSTAAINDLVLAGARQSDRVEVVAVGSRSGERARAWADERGIPRAHGSYEELLADDEVEAVYISLPNGLHVEWTLRALEAGKHVLVEKPFSRHAHEVQRCFDLADERGLVLSEAFMWRHHPQTARLLELAEEIGPLRLVRAAFSFPLDRPDDVRWSAALDGGSLMDVGCYCISAARLLAGEPHLSVALATGPEVDAHLAGVLRFESGAIAHFDCGFDMPARDELEVVGAHGSLFLDDPWHCREPGIDLRHADDTVERIEIERVDPYMLELEDVTDAAREGREPLLGRADAVGQARVLETILQ